MSLRSRLVLVLGSLVALLLAAEWSLVRALTRDLDQEVDDVALAVGSSMVNLFVTPVDPGDGDSPLAGRLHAIGTRLAPPDGEEDGGAERSGTSPGPRRELVRMRRLFAGEDAVFDVEALTRELEREHFDVTVDRRGPARRLGGDLEFVMVSAHGPEPRDGELRWTEGTPGAPRAASLELRVGSRRVRSQPLARLELEHEVELREFPSAAPSGSAPRAAPPVFATAAWSDDAPELDTPVRIPVPRSGLERAVEGFLSKLLMGSIGLFVVGLGAIAWVAHRVTRPLRSLADAARRVGGGELGAQVPVEGDREVSGTLEAFNHMSARLSALDEEARVLREREHLGELGEVARGLAHALRNPLHTLGLAVDSLAAPGSEADAVGVAHAARTQIQRIDGALKSFLTLSAGGGDRELVGLDDLARDVALELAQSTEPVRVRVEAPDGPVPVEGLPAELRSVAHALVVNAAEADPGAELVVRVTRGADSAGAPRARLDVLDRGPGLSPEVRGRLFTPHVTTKQQGAGMGLFLAERIARTRYGGSLALHERAGGGVRATLELPAADPTCGDAGGRA